MKHLLSIFNYKLFIISGIVFLFTTCAFAQAPSWGWAKSAGGQKNDVASDITTDSQGNVFVVGNFSSDSIVFGNIKLYNASSLGSTDIFVAKYNSNGSVIWAKSFGGTVSDFGNSICTDANGNIIFTGSYLSNSITFGAFTLLGGGGSHRIFTAMLEANGNIVWAKTAAATSDVKGKAISTDKDNFIYVTGYFNYSTIAFNSNIINNSGGADVFVVKYNTSGNAVWAKSFGGSSTDIALGIANDLNGNVYLTGWFDSDTLIVGASSHYNTSGNDDIFLIKTDSSGNPIWSQSFGGNSWEEGSAITVDLNSNVYLTGYFSSDTLIWGQTKLTNNSNSAKIYITKINQNGTIDWAKTSTTANNDFAFDVCSDQNGEVYLTGRFWVNTLTFGSTSITKTGLQTNIFIFKVDASGNDMWGLALPVGGTNLMDGNDITIDQFGSIYTSGYFAYTNVSFPPFSINNLGASDVFVAKLNKTVGYQDFANKNNTSISVYPNPFCSETVFYFNTDVIANNLIIEIYDIAGKKIALYEVNESREFIFNRNNISEGMYIYLIKNKNGLIDSGKLLIQN